MNQAFGLNVVRPSPRTNVRSGREGKIEKAFNPYETLAFEEFHLAPCGAVSQHSNLPWLELPRTV
jgi:hypothetical protein